MKRSKKQEEREDKVRDTLKELKDKHGNSFSPMQFRIWSEMIAGELHSSLNEPPSTSMFIKAGNPVTPKDKNKSTVQTLTDVATALVSALSPQPTSVPSPGPVKASSPAKIIEGRSKCYKQLSELNNLRLSAVIDDTEYETEREAIMAVLKTLKTAG